MFIHTLKSCNYIQWNLANHSDQCPQKTGEKLDESKNDSTKGSECILVMNLHILAVDLALEEEILIMAVSSNVRLSGVYCVFRRSTEEWLWVLKQLSVGSGAGATNCGPNEFSRKGISQRRVLKRICVGLKCSISLLGKNK